jgi:agmatinase
MTFDPDAAALPDSGLFGLACAPADAEVHVIPVPFDATTSYRKGTHRGPEAVLRASRQVDLFDLLTGRPYERGIALLEPDPRITELNEEGSAEAERIIAVAGVLGGDKRLETALARVNAIGEEVNALVHAATKAVLDQKRLPVVLGGDHSTPFGAIRACAERHKGLGVLHFDAHSDLRDAFEGFAWSHASILHNVATRIPQVAKIVQVGIRDFGERELAFIQESRGRIRTLFDADWQRAKVDQMNLRELVKKRLDDLPEKVFVSFDVDGLDPTLCPNTGTPVPGGFTWSEAMLWLEELARSGREVVGCDVNEVNPGPATDELDSWDAIVGARLLYRLIGVALMTRKPRGARTQG